LCCIIELRSSLSMRNWWGHPIYWYTRCTYSRTHTRTHHSSSCQAT
jgi:hypothetical protein